MVEWDPFEDWERNTAPDSAAERNLMAALEILYGRGDAELARRYLERCLRIGERALAEGVLHMERCKVHAPQNQGVLRRALAYARALLGTHLQAETLLAAEAPFEAACAGFTRRRWDTFDSEVYLSALRLALLADSADVVERLSRLRRPTRAHREQHELLTELAAAVSANERIQDKTYQTRFDTFFDLARHPEYDPAEYSDIRVLRLDLGLLRDKFLVSPDGEIDWQRAIDAIAR